MPWIRKRELLPARLLRGRRAEALAREYLTKQGFALLQCNVRYPVGEIDIIAQESNTLCFVEVRSTSSAQWGGPLASITDRKRKRLVRAARWYLQYAENVPDELRFDVIAVDWSAPENPGIELIRSAFNAEFD